MEIEKFRKTLASKDMQIEKFKNEMDAILHEMQLLRDAQLL